MALGPRVLKQRRSDRESAGKWEKLLDNLMLESGHDGDSKIIFLNSTDFKKESMPDLTLDVQEILTERYKYAGWDRVDFGSESIEFNPPKV